MTALLIVRPLLQECWGYRRTPPPPVYVGLGFVHARQVLCQMSHRSKTLKSLRLFKHVQYCLLLSFPIQRYRLKLTGFVLTKSSGAKLEQQELQLASFSEAQAPSLPSWWIRVLSTRNDRCYHLYLECTPEDPLVKALASTSAISGGVEPLKSGISWEVFMSIGGKVCMSLEGTQDLSFSSQVMNCLTPPHTPAKVTAS